MDTILNQGETLTLLIEARIGCITKAIDQAFNLIEKRQWSLYDLTL